MQDYEKLGVFYMGREVDLATGEKSERPLLYDSKDLTTHAVVVGMTGSGKTGLCLDLLEEAGIDRIPAIVIDPKGDIANLLLTFPNLSPEEFRPWIDESQASREGVSPDEFATRESEKWRKGLASWGQDGARIQKFRDTVDLQVFTPGSNTGRPLTILKSFSAPGPEIVNDPDAFRERISAAVSGLLALLGVDADPIRSREHILLSNLLDKAWSEGRDMNLGQLIAEIQNPPFEQVGIMDLDTFFPSKDRMELAMTMNNLLASPAFASWMVGEPLNIKRLLHSEDGKPRISIMSISHLNDSERMFFVTILLNEVLSWMRSQAGTSSLRALLYMDEVFGYFPPTANPPSKQPMLTLLKQARAFGLGVVLATQNPVDLDYKGLSNTGTWFLGRLQTERDKARVIEGLEGAAANTGASFNKAEIEQILAGLGSRKFLMNNVHEDEPVVFETRWAMSYLRGPLTRTQIQDLIGDVPETTSQTPLAAAATRQTTRKPAASASSAAAAAAAVQVDPRKLIPSDIDQRYAEIQERVGDSDRIVYRPAFLATGRLHFVRATYKVDTWTERTFLVNVNGDEVPDDVWDESDPVEGNLELDRNPAPNAEFAEIPKQMQKERAYASWEKELKDFLYREQNMEVFKCKELKAFSEPHETRGDFKVRLEQLASEKRDTEVEKLRKKYAAKFDTLRKRIRRAEDKVEKEKEQYQHTRMNSFLSLGTSILGAVMGRKTVSATNVRRAGSSVKAMGRTQREKGDIGRAEESLEDLQVDWEELEADFKKDVEVVEDKLHVDDLELEELVIRPRKGDLDVDDFTVVWLPWRVDSSGISEPVF